MKLWEYSIAEQDAGEPMDPFQVKIKRPVGNGSRYYLNHSVNVGVSGILSCHLNQQSIHFLAICWMVKEYKQTLRRPPRHRTWKHPNQSMSYTDSRVWSISWENSHPT